MKYENLKVGMICRTIGRAWIGAGHVMKCYQIDNSETAWFTPVHSEKIDGYRDICMEIAYVEQVIDYNAPMFTAEGTPVEIITVSGRDKKYPVLAYEGKAKLPSKFTLEGISKSGEARRNLTNVQPDPSECKEEAIEEVVLYTNLYEYNHGSKGYVRSELGVTLYHSIVEANEEYKQGRVTDSRHPKRTGVAKVILVKGKLPSRFYK